MLENFKVLSNTFINIIYIFFFKISYFKAKKILKVKKKKITNKKTKEIIELFLMLFFNLKFFLNKYIDIKINKNKLFFINREKSN